MTALGVPSRGLSTIQTWSGRKGRRVVPSTEGTTVGTDERDEERKWRVHSLNTTGTRTTRGSDWIEGGRSKWTTVGSTSLDKLNQVLCKDSGTTTGRDLCVFTESPQTPTLVGSRLPSPSGSLFSKTEFRHSHP